MLAALASATVGLLSVGRDADAADPGPVVSPTTAPASPATGPAWDRPTKPFPVARMPRDVDPAAPPTVTRVYDLRDLIAHIPDFTNGPDLLADDPGRGFGSLAQAAVDAPSRPWVGMCFPPAPSARALPRGEWDVGKTKEQLIEDIVQVMQEVVAPDSWRETGGTLGAVREMSGQLIITQSAENHAAIADLLGQLREVQNINVRVRALWVLVSERDALDRVLRPATVTGRSQLPGAAQAAAASRPAGARSPLLTATAAELASLPAVLARFDAETVCANGQRVYVGSVRNRSAGAGGTTAAAPEAAVASPTIPPLLSGLTLDVRQVLSPDRATSLLTLAAQWKEARIEPAGGGTVTSRATATTRPSAGGDGVGGGSTTTAEVTAPVDRRDGRTQEIRTSMRVPLGQMALVGGTTLDSTLPTAADARNGPAAVPPRLYLFVEVTAD